MKWPSSNPNKLGELQAIPLDAITKEAGGEADLRLLIPRKLWGRCVGSVPTLHGYNVRRTRELGLSARQHFVFGHFGLFAMNYSLLIHDAHVFVCLLEGRSAGLTLRMTLLVAYIISCHHVWDDSASRFV